jgi:archaeal flagellar protein FlaJ
MKKNSEVNETSMFSFTGYCYQYFGWIGRGIGRFFRSSKIEDTLQDAGLKIYPQAYFAVIGFFFMLSLLIVLPIVLVSGFFFLLPLPLLVLLLGYGVPKIARQDRANKLDLEVPFAGAYISVMATGGLSPYASLKRLKTCGLLPNICKVIEDIELDVEVKGYDPTTAMEKSAKNLPSRDYRDLMLGYASTVRTGGDVVHYLLIRTETMFKDLAVKVKAFGERANLLMESYVTLSILMTLTLTILFMTSMSFQSFWGGDLSSNTFQIYSYFLVPGVAMVFLFVSDSQQVSQPISEWRPYKAFLVTLPVTVFLLLVIFLPFAAPELTLPFAGPFVNFITWLRVTFGLNFGYEAGLGMGVTLLVTSVFGVIAHSYYTRSHRGIEHEVTSFMRDLTETRKTGSSPERCLESLSGRNYGVFSDTLRTASRQIRWGFPFKVIYSTVKSRITSWLALINIYLLVDAIEVGGGTPETLETLTHFSEELSSLDKEKTESMRPLIIMPYIGAGILIISTLILLVFSNSILDAYAHQSIPFSEVVTLILPPLMVQVFFTGLVTGKLSSGVTSNGFKHSLVLIILGLVLIPLAAYLTLPFIGGT